MNTFTAQACSYTQIKISRQRIRSTPPHFRLDFEDMRYRLPDFRENVAIEIHTFDGRIVASGIG
jgi:hypothetical protein